MNLENLKLVELNAREVQEVEGGLFFNRMNPSGMWFAGRECGKFAYGFINGFLDNL